MSEVEEKCSVEYENDECEFLQGNTVVFEAGRNDCEIRADVTVKKQKCTRIWGQVTDCGDSPIEGALVKLVKEVCQPGKKILIGVAHTVTDCLGFYQFDICKRYKKGVYRVIVGKAAMGKEKVAERAECAPCDVKVD